MNLRSIHDEVTELLSKNPDKVESRRRAFAALRKGLEKGLPFPLPKQRAWFSTTQTQATEAQGCACVQVLGVGVGALVLDRADNSWVFVPAVVEHTERLESAGERWVWSKNKEDGKKIRDFLRACEKRKGADPKNEREIQWQLANALRSRPKMESLEHLRAVEWHKCFTEVGVSVTSEGTVGTGNIDLVVRRGKGANRGFLVFEVKGPGTKNVEATLKQALRYATALAIEANGGSERECDDYHAVFGSKGKKPLQIDAVIVMEDIPEVCRRAEKLVPQYLADRGDSAINRIGVLLYKFDGKAVRAWRWLPGRDPRNTAV